MFVELVGVTKAQGSVEYPMLEYCIREDLKLKVKRMMAVLDPVKLVIDNYPSARLNIWKWLIIRKIQRWNKKSSIYKGTLY